MLRLGAACVGRTGLELCGGRVTDSGLQSIGKLTGEGEGGVIGMRSDQGED